MVNLHALCGSHISNGDAARLGALRGMVGSWRLQTSRDACPLLVSMSCDAGIAPLVTRVVEQLLRESGGDLRITVHVGERHSQFQHYRSLVKGASPIVPPSGVPREGFQRGSAPWVMFTDDDDVWHPRRVEYYLNGIAELEVEPSERVLALCVRGVAIGPFQGSDVERAIACGKVKTSKRNDHGLEHWMFGCRVSTLEDFLDRASEELIADRYCDMYLVKYLAYSEGFMCGEIPVQASADAMPPMWEGALYAYRHERGAARFDQGMPESEIVRHLVVLAYIELTGGTPDMLRRKLVAAVEKSYGFKASDRFLRACRELVESGEVDAFVKSPMPDARPSMHRVQAMGARCERHA